MKKPLLSLKVEIEPVDGQIPGDYIAIRESVFEEGRIEIEVHDFIPGEMASVSMTKEDARRLVEALNEMIAIPTWGA